MTWRQHTDAAIVDLKAALTGAESGSLEHLREALRNVEFAVERREDEIEEDEGTVE